MDKSKRSDTGSEQRPVRVRVFVASPSDVATERDAVSLVVAEVNRILGEHLGFPIAPLRWETDARPGVGEDPQEVINRQITDYDVFVGVMWRRFGTPTKRAKSGTGEEFQRALDQFKKNGRPTIMFYFRTEPFYTTDKNELNQFAKVARFQSDLRKLGVLYWQYRSPIDFERYFREHLMRHLLSLSGGAIAPAQAVPRVIEGRIAASTVAPTASGVGHIRHNVFLAYRHPDENSARTLFRELLAAGHRVWMDVENLLPGQMWLAEVKAAVARSSAFVVLLSGQTSADQNFVSKEFELAQSRLQQGLRVLPVRLEPVALPAGFKDYQAVDLFSPDGLQRLLSALQGPAA
jgi:TIR domain/Domain of unknown function (DUF4062)